MRVAKFTSGGTAGQPQPAVPGQLAYRRVADPAHSLSLRQRLDRNTVLDYRAYLARRRAWQAGRRGTR